MFGHRIAIARAMCAVCRVAGRCLMEALAEEAQDNGRRYGMRGGLTGPERKALARGQARGVDAFSKFARRRAAQAAA